MISKKHYQSFKRNKDTKPVQQEKIITYQPKSFENLNILDIKSVITEKTSKKFKNFTYLNYDRLKK